MSHDAAVREWAPLAYHVAGSFRFPGADRDDVRQEALIALWQALPRYDGTGSLRGWLAFCVRRKLSSKLREHGRVKHRALNEALREPDSFAGDYVLGGSGSLSVLLAPLTPLEQRACVGVACGLTYAELGPPKAVDNALQRARVKLAASVSAPKEPTR